MSHEPPKRRHLRAVPPPPDGEPAPEAALPRIVPLRLVPPPRDVPPPDDPPLGAA